MRFAKPTTAELGECGEAFAAAHISSLGWRLLGRRVRTAHAELDLVALDDQVLVAIEVKTGRGTLHARRAPREHLGRRTLLRQAKALRDIRPLGPCRIDLVEILILKDGSRHLTHLVELKPKGPKSGFEDRYSTNRGDSGSPLGPIDRR